MVLIKMLSFPRGRLLCAFKGKAPSSPCVIYKRNLNQQKEEAKNTEDDKDAPIPYLGSRAAKWRASDTFYGEKHNWPPSQRYVIFASTVIFLLYFILLREENDHDEWLKQPLWQRIPGLEKKQLISCIADRNAKGLDSSEYKARLLEIIEAEERGEGGNVMQGGKWWVKPGAPKLSESPPGW